LNIEFKGLEKGDRRIWSIEKSRSRCSGKFVIGFDPNFHPKRAQLCRSLEDKAPNSHEKISSSMLESLKNRHSLSVLL
jgi:hypothetical protein